MTVIEKVKLGDLVTIRTGKLDANASSKNGEYPFFTCAREPLKIDTYSYDCECVLVAGNGDLNVKYYDGKFDAYQRTYIVESLDEKQLYTRYLYWFLDNYIEKLRQLSIGGVIKYIKLNNLTDPEIPLPPLEEQKRIVHTLDQADLLRQKRQKAISLIDDYLKAMFLEMFGDPISNPKGIKTAKIKDLGDVVTGNTPSRKASENYGDFIEWIKSDNINNHHHYLTKATEFLSEKGLQKGRSVPEGSILVTCIAGSLSCIGNVSMTDRKVAFNQQINAIVPKSGIESSFLYSQILFGKKKFRQASTNSMKGMLSKSNFSEIELMNPDEDMQKEYSRVFDRTYNLKQKMIRQNKELDKQFQALTQKVFQNSP